MTDHLQLTPYESPWTVRQRLLMLLWGVTWFVFCRWTPKPLNAWRLLWLRLFGATISGRPFVHQRARITLPWNLTLSDRACLGDRSEAYSLGPVIVEEGATVAQEVCLCTGTHDFLDPALPLVTRGICIGRHAFIGARAFLLPGITIGEGAVVGACSVVTRDVPPWSIVAGNPARVLGQRPEDSVKRPNPIK